MDQYFYVCEELLKKPICQADKSHIYIYIYIYIYTHTYKSFIGVLLIYNARLVSVV